MKLNQIKFYTDMKTFMESFKAWMNQMTFMQTISLIGKEFVFSTDTVDALKVEITRYSRGRRSRTSW